MCTNLIKIKSKNPYQKLLSWVPCGKCSECRRANKSQWSTRLNAEIEHYHTNLKYNVGFFTLTYNDRHLPYIPKSFFKDNYEKIPCFSYKDIKKFTDTIRTYLWRTYNITDGFRYFITSEYGEKYHRPHYHGIILFNNKINHKTMYEILEDAWCGTTNHIPNNKKSKRKNLGIIAPYETFVPKDNYACGAYVAKYVCKDLEFTNTTKNKFEHLTKKMRNHLRHFQPFHKQSMAFGACILKNKNDNDIIKMYNEGISFTGNPKNVELPVYIKNKILFTTHKLYNLNTHKFETTKKYTKFFYDHKEEIYNKKLNQNTEYLKSFMDPNYWKINEIKNSDYWANEAANTCTQIINDLDIDQLAGFYTLYHGLDYKKCKYFKNPVDGIFARYNPCADLENLENIPYEYYYWMNNGINLIMGLKHLTQSVERKKIDEKIDEIRSFWNSYK